MSAKWEEKETDRASEGCDCKHTHKWLCLAPLLRSPDAVPQHTNPNACNQVDSSIQPSIFLDFYPYLKDRKSERIQLEKIEILQLLIYYDD